MSKGTRIETPILNGPFTKPSRHYRFDDDGITDEVVDQRRRSEYFMPIPGSKKKGGKQGELVFDEWTKDRIEENQFINEVRTAVDVWRRSARISASRESPVAKIQPIRVRTRRAREGTRGTSR